MGLPTKSRLKLSRPGQAGFLLIETMGWFFIFGVLLVGTHSVIIRYWNVQLENLERKRIKYDGVLQWKP
jgi:hypothetical protein